MSRPRELTGTAIVLGVLLAVVFGAANAYLGLRVGLTVSASIPAAVVSMGVLRFVLRRESILENNLVQTIGSAGESLAAGAVFTMPALYLWADEGVAPVPDVLSLTAVALAGGLLGVLVMIPLRRPLIVEEDAALVYPEGRACAEVLKAGESGAGGAGRVFAGLGFAVVFKLLTDLFKVVPSVLVAPVRWLRGEVSFELSTALAGVGFIVGPRVGGLLLAGAVLAWLVLIPLFCAFSDSALALYLDGGARAVWREQVRFVGAGAIAAGGFYSLAKSVPLLVKTVWAARTRGRASDAAREDLPMGRVLLGIAAIVLFLAALPVVPIGLGGALLVAVFGFFFAAVSARMVGLVGSSNNPISGMTIATLVAAAFVLKVCGTAGAAGMVGAMTVGTLVCIIAAMAGDMSQDLKTGYLLGATPWKQQVGELVGAVASGLTIVGTLVLLHKAWGFGSDAIAAPQATLMKAVVEGIMGGTLPWTYLGIGVVLALALVVCRVPVMPFAIGLYLPFGMSAAIFAGSLLQVVCRRTSESRVQQGVLVSAGLIAGEGVCGIVLAILTLMR